MIGAGALVKCLELENVEVVFGYPGAVICPVFDELDKSAMKPAATPAFPESPQSRSRRQVPAQ